MKKIIVFLLFGTVIGLGWFLWYSRFFSITIISCAQDHGSCSVDVQAELERRRGEHALFLNTSAISEKIKNANTTIQTATVSIKLPRELTAFVISRVPVVQLHAMVDVPQYFLVDREGMILGMTDKTTTLPILELQKQTQLNVGAVVDKHIQVGIGLIDALSGHLDSHKLPTIHERVLTAHIAEGAQVIFSLDKSSGEQLEALQVIRNQARIEAAQYQRIDLRFDQPIITK